MSKLIELGTASKATRSTLATPEFPDGLWQYSNCWGTTIPWSDMTQNGVLYYD